MTQRTWAAMLAVPLFVGLGFVLALTGLPFVTYAPGPSINVLGENAGKPIIDVTGHPTYRDDGQLRMTTVSVTERNARLDLFTLMWTWVHPAEAVYPFFAQYPSGGTQQQDTREGQVEMQSSQSSAVAAALKQLGYHLHPRLQIATVTPGMPADGQLQPGDVLVRVGGTPIDADTDVASLIAKVPDGGSVPVVVERDGRRVRVSLSPVEKEGHRLIGVTLQVHYDFPFDVSININDAIGGPSAGLMFALSIYDVLTPGSLTDGDVIAGTGTIDPQGRVGEIGGIQQKIAGAHDDGAQLFLVPPGNCADALGARRGSTRLAKAATLQQAIAEVTAWTADHDAPLPQCKPTAAAGSES
jgi:PDZ domain-containing protein